MVLGAACSTLPAQNALPDQPLSPRELINAGRYEEALPLLVALEQKWDAAVTRDPRPENQLDWARVLLSLGMVEDRVARFDTAIPRLEQALDLFETHQAPATLRGDALDALGLATHHAGDLLASESWFQRALEVRATTPEDQRDYWVAATRDHLGLLYLTLGRYEDAGDLLQQSLGATAKDDPALLAQRQGYVARYLHALHNYARARDLLEQAVTNAETAWGRDHPNTYTLLAQLGLTLQRLDDTASARAMLEEAVGLARKHATDTTGALRLSTFLNNLGSLAIVEGDAAAATALFTESLEIVRGKLGDTHPALAPLWNNLACAQQEAGEFAKADEGFQKACTIYLERMGPRHQRSVEALRNLALNSLLAGDDATADQQIAEASTAAERVLKELVSFGSERQRLNYLQGVDTLSLACSAGRDPGLIADTILGTKGRLLEALLEEARREPTPLDLQFRALQHRLDRELLSSPDPDAPLIDTLRTEVAALAPQVNRSRRSSPGATPPRWRELQAKLIPGSAYVDFVRFTDFTATPRWTPRFGAILLLPDGEPRWIPLGTEEALESWLAALDQRLDYRASQLQGIEDAPVPIFELKPALRQLHDQFWKPVADMLPRSTHTICLSPDAGLNFVSFATLLDANDRFVAEEFELCVYFASGRDLLIDPATTPLDAGPWEIFAVDSFADATPATREPAAAFEEKLDAAIAGLAPLSGAQREADLLRDLAPPDSHIYEGAKATELQLRAITPSPAVLHLITHGFFLGGNRPAATDPRLQDFDDDPLPLYRSGLVLHGAKAKLGDPDLESDRDDILFSADVAALPLDGTRLVTLSSCQSALGDTLAAEGVLGLRRGVAVAGAHNLLLTLWPVSDATTPDFMQRFYTIARETNHLAQAAWQTQREALANVDRSDPEALETAVLTTGPFVLCQRQGLAPPQAVTPPRHAGLHGLAANKPWLIVSGTSLALALAFLGLSRRKG